MEVGYIGKHEGAEKLPQKAKKIGDGSKKLFFCLNKGKYKSCEWLVNFPQLMIFP